MLFAKYKNDDFGVLEHYLEIIYYALVQSLNRIGYICAYINTEHEENIVVFMNLFDVDDDALIRECFELIEINEETMSKTINKEDASNKELIVTLKFILPQENQTTF